MELDLKQECDECGQRDKPVVEFGHGEDYRRGAGTLCAKCLIQGLAIINDAGELERQKLLESNKKQTIMWCAHRMQVGGKFDAANELALMAKAEVADEENLDKVELLMLYNLLTKYSFEPGTNTASTAWAAITEARRQVEGDLRRIDPGWEPE